jgi:hypothetical protein
MDAQAFSGTPVSGGLSLARWLSSLARRLEVWGTSVQMREIEAYLAQAQDLADLEQRMRRLQDARRSRPLLLR